MKLNLAIITALTFLIIFGCGKNVNENAQKKPSKAAKQEKRREKKEAPEQSKSEKKNLTNTKQIKEEAEKTIKAQFEMMVANTGGTFVVFKDTEGESTWYRKASGTEELDFAMGLQPGDKSNKYNGIWYEITFEVRTENRKGHEQKRRYIVKATPTSAPEIPLKWKPQTLKNIKFFGTEPNWTLVLKETYAEYTPMGGETKRIVYNKASSKDKSTLTAYTIGNQADIFEISGILSGSVSTVIMIKQTSCSNGMSDNTYSYATRLEFKGKKAYEGCGRLVE